MLTKTSCTHSPPDIPAIAEKNIVTKTADITFFSADYFFPLPLHLELEVPGEKEVHSPRL